MNLRCVVNGMDTVRRPTTMDPTEAVAEALESAEPEQAADSVAMLRPLIGNKGALK